MAEQTAIQWLIDRYNEDPYDCLIKTGLFAKALEMEEQQINKACYDGYYKEDEKYTYDYYNETFNK
jgi:hypothetical protein